MQLPQILINPRIVAAELSTLVWEESPLFYVPDMDKAKVHIEADDGDVLPAASKVPQDSQDPTADVGEDGVGIAVDDSSCSSTAAVSRQKISDKEVRLAGEAKRHYLEGRFAEALDPMLALARMRPEDPLVVANAAAVQFQACRISMEEAYSALQQLYLAIVKGEPQI